MLIQEVLHDEHPFSPLSTIQIYSIGLWWFIFPLFSVCFLSVFLAAISSGLLFRDIRLMRNTNYCSNSILGLSLRLTLLMINLVFCVFQDFRQHGRQHHRTLQQPFRLPHRDHRDHAQSVPGHATRIMSDIMSQACPPPPPHPPPPHWQCLRSLPIRKHCHISEKCLFFCVTTGTIGRCRFTAKRQHRMNYLCKYNLFPRFY